MLPIKEKINKFGYIKNFDPFLIPCTKSTQNGLRFKCRPQIIKTPRRKQDSSFIAFILALISLMWHEKHNSKNESMLN